MLKNASKYWQHLLMIECVHNRSVSPKKRRYEILAFEMA